MRACVRACARTRVRVCMCVCELVFALFYTCHCVSLRSLVFGQTSDLSLIKLQFFPKYIYVL